MEYAAANPALPGQEAWVPVEPPTWLEPGSELKVDTEDLESISLPAVAWDAPAAFAAANGMSTSAGKALIRDVLVLAHRTPRFWAQVRAGRVPAWRARKIAQALLGQHEDVCAYVDREVVERVETHGAIGPVVVERLIDEAMLRLHAEERELDQLEALDKRHVTVDPDSINHTGIGELDARADWADLTAFDDTVGALAEALTHLPEHEHESLDVRRSIALGILADPARALALLSGDLDAKPSRVREVTATLDLTQGNLLGLDPVTTDADLKFTSTRSSAPGPAAPTSVGRQGHPTTAATSPAAATTAPARPTARPCRPGRQTYAPTARDRQPRGPNPTCVHPHCNRPARLCDCDHITPFDPAAA